MGNLSPLCPAERLCPAPLCRGLKQFNLQFKKTRNSFYLFVPPVIIFSLILFSVIFNLSVSLVFTFLYRLKHLNDHRPFVVSIFWSCSHFSFLYIHLPGEDIWSCTLGCSRVLAVPSPLPVCSEWPLTPHYIFITPIWYWWFETSLHWKVTKALLHSSWQLLPIYPERGKIPIIGPVAPFQHFLSENCHSSLRVFSIPLLSISSLLEWNFATYLSLLYQQLNTCCPAVPSLLQHSTEEWETVPSPWSPAMKCFSSVPVLARKVLQKPCCVFFTVPFWPARVFCMAGYCHVALKFCIKPRQKPEDHNGVKQVRREGRQKTHGRNAAVTWYQLAFILEAVMLRCVLNTKSEHSRQWAWIYLPCSSQGTLPQGKEQGL